jgi:hypothetical protein
MLKKHSLQIAALLSTILALTTVALAGLQQKQSAGPTPRPITSQQNVRYQVVNGSPEFVGNTMLLDTETGRTWIKCAINVSVDSRPSGHGVGKHE